MTYEHVLRLPVSEADAAGLDTDAALSRARRVLWEDHDVDIRKVGRSLADPAVIVVVRLLGRELPDDLTAETILRALGLPARPAGPVTAVVPAVPASGTWRGTFSGPPLAPPGRAEPPRRPAPLGAPAPEHRFDGPPAGAGGGAIPAAAAEPRRLHAECPERVRPDRTFSMLVRIVTIRAGGEPVKLADVPPEGTDVLLVLHAPGFDVLGEQRWPLHVPQAGDSEPVRFDLRARRPGARQVSVTAWHGGSYLGELAVEIAVDPAGRDAPARDVLGEVAIRPVPGAVALAVRYAPDTRTYRFEFHDVDNPAEVTSNLAYDPGPRVEWLIGELDAIATGGAGMSAAETRAYLAAAGAELWHDLLPQALRDQFWDRQDRITQLTILTENDIVPWELLYPLDPGHDEGFLVEQFPVTRGIFDRAPAGRLRLRPARFVLPGGSPPEAGREISEIAGALAGPRPGRGDIVRGLTPLLDLLRSGDFGLLHFACHGNFDPVAGASIRFGDARFTPTLLAPAEINKTLAARAPLVFVNACRSGGLAPSYNGMDGFARKFLAAGATAFIGSMWAVVDGAAFEFAAALYEGLSGGDTLGAAVTQARREAASQPGDPSWLAYSVYGDPGARLAPD